tara:strand:+ start:45 stop:983 length:939 start_codon:yes stop_codon:yes gene_type:complete
MKKKINLFFFGAGNIIENHIKTAKHFSEFEMYGIKSRTFSKANNLKKKFKIKNCFKDYNNIKVPKNQKSIAIIGVSIENTFEVYKKIYDLFDICILEKPLGYNLDEANKIFLQSKKSKTKIFVALNRRFFFSTQELLKKISKDESNRVVEIIDTQTPELFKNRFPNKIIKNWIFANSIHMIDYINILCRGHIKKIRTIYKKKDKIKILELLFSSKDICIYKQYWNRPGPWSVSVSNNKGYYRLEPLEELYFREKNDISFKKHEKEKYDLIFKPGFYNMYRNLSLFVQKNKDNLVNLEKSLNLMKLINKIKKK